MIIKCVSCNLPMSESNKNKPENMPPQNKWIVCRQCKGGVEVIGADEPVAGKATNTKALEYEEIAYITIKQTKDGIIKSRYSDKERKVLLGEEKLG